MNEITGVDNKSRGLRRPILREKRAKEALDHVAIVGNVGSVGNGVIGFGGNVGERSLFDRVNNLSAVFAAFNAVDLREKGRQDGGVNGNGMGMV
ncbi:hypothetical protein AgCh_007564 [Apium graveolens]